MSGFISLIMDVLSIEITLGSFTTNLGSLLFFLLIIRYVSNRFFHELISNYRADERARHVGFLNVSERAEYDKYMAGGERHKDGKYY